MIILATYAVPHICLIYPLIIYTSYKLMKKVIKSIRETTRLQALSKSPLISYFTESINGASTIRAFELNNQFILENNRLLNRNIVASQMCAGVSLWFSIRVDFMAICLLLSISFVCVLSRDYTDPVILSMLLNYSTSIQSCLSILLQL